MSMFPFNTDFTVIVSDPDPYIDSVFSCLESEFMVMPKGDGFVDYPCFEDGYEALKSITQGFSVFNPEEIYPVALEEPISIIVLRTMLGFTPPEWGYVTTQKTSVAVSQGFIRSIDRKIRMAPKETLKPTPKTEERIKAMIKTACGVLISELPEMDSEKLHRLDKADTRNGLSSIMNCSQIGVPYAMLLYERFLGRPFAGHRDSVSDIIGDSLESAIEDVLASEGVSYRKTKRAERIEGFDQTPDFIIPSEFNPQVVIEAKITEDDGTARDKVTRIQHLGELSLEGGRSHDNPKYEVIACIGGRGFGVRREDMKKMLIATRGKVFTAKTLKYLVDHSKLKKYKKKNR